MEDEFKNKSVF